MSLSAAASGLVVVFLSVQVVQAQNGYGVTYSSTRICALKGSTVVISCSYTYPYRVGSLQTHIMNRIWFIKMNGNEPVDLRSDPEYSGRVQSSCDDNSCTLTITDVRESDSAEYKFTFTTSQPGGSYTGSPGVTLSVTDLQVKVETSSRSTWATLKCHSSCSLPSRPSYVWYKNGQKIQTATSSYISDYFSKTDSYSCAVRGHEDLPSPPVCGYGQTCNRVTYTSRSICASKGSTVDVSCSYHSYTSITSKLWFRPDRSHRWWDSSQPEDLQTDSQSAGRVQVTHTWTGLSTLRISDLTESDSAEYRFKFTAGSFAWTSSLPGTTLTVTALQVKVTRKPLTTTKVELKCESSCRPADRLSYVWFKNGQEVTGEETSSYEGWFSDGDVISCALRGHESVRSPSVYGPKLPSVSVSPSGEIVEGSSVNLSCSSDANPAANYTWYKEDEESPKASGQTFTITDFRPEHSGNYYCEAFNSRGRHNSTLHLVVAAKKSTTMMMNIIRLSVVVLVLVLIGLLLFCLFKSWSLIIPTSRPASVNAALHCSRGSEEDTQ